MQDFVEAVQRADHPDDDLLEEVMIRCEVVRRLRPAGFFFSSRRRHTRSTRDWSSDVCSSDLVYVVHTRRGQADPLHVGLGMSFRYNPYTDSFLVIPAAVQTLLISARCICAERQGVLVQAYVQRSEERRVGKEGRSRWPARQGS